MRCSAPDHPFREREPLSLLLFGGVAERDERLGMPAVGQVEGISHQFGNEQGRAHPTGGQAEVLGCQEQVLAGERGALHGHQPFGLLAAPVRVVIHAFQGEGGRDQRRRASDAGVADADSPFDERGVDAVGAEVGAPARAHAVAQVLLGRVGSDNAEAPGLAVVG